MIARGYSGYQAVNKIHVDYEVVVPTIHFRKVANKWVTTVDGKRISVDDAFRKQCEESAELPIFEGRYASLVFEDSPKKTTTKDQP